MISKINHSIAKNESRRAPKMLHNGRQINSLSTKWKLRFVVHFCPLWMTACAESNGIRAQLRADLSANIDGVLEPDQDAIRAGNRHTWPRDKWIHYRDQPSDGRTCWRTRKIFTQRQKCLSIRNFGMGPVRRYGGVKGRPTWRGRLGPCLGGPWQRAVTGEAPWWAWWPWPCRAPAMRSWNKRKILVLFC